MKKFFHGVTGFCRFLILAGLGLGLLALTVAGNRCGGQDCWLWLLESLGPYRFQVMAAGGGIVILECLHLLTRPRPGKTPEAFSIKSKGGTLSFRTEAVRDALARVATEFDSVAEMETRVTQFRNQLDLDLDVRVVAGSSIPDLCEDLQKRTREVAAQEIGLFKLRQVRVHIRDLLQPESSVPLSAPAPVTPPPPAKTEDESLPVPEETP